MKTLCHILLVVVSVLCVSPAHAGQRPQASSHEAAPTERFFDIFQPFRSASAALSPDGRYLAYSVREGEKTSIVTVEVSNPGVIKSCVFVGTDDSANPMFSDNDENIPLVVLWMGWVTSNRLVVMTNQAAVFAHTATWDRNGETGREDSFAEPGLDAQDSLARFESTTGWVSTPGTFFAMDADGKNARMISDAYKISLVIPDTDPFDGRLPFSANSPSLLHRGTFGNAHVVYPGFFDYSPDDPASTVIQVGVPGRGTYFCALNAMTGKATVLNQNIGTSGYLPIYDRQGKLRIGIDREPRAFPVSYLLAKEGLSFGRWKNLDETFRAVGNFQFSLSPANYFTERSFPLGFDENPDILYYASNIGRDTYGIYALNIKTGQRTDFAFERSDIDVVNAPSAGFVSPSNLVFDRYDRKLAGIRYTDVARQSVYWIKPELAKAQKALEDRFPRYSVEITEWSKDLTKILALVHNCSDPGSFIIYSPETNSALDIVRRSKFTDLRAPHRVFPFALTTPDGIKVSGQLTFPTAGRFDKVPVVVRCPSQPWQRAPLTFQPETAALADMGFAVLQLDSRGAWGFGIKRRESIKNGYETALVSDIVFAIDNLAKTYRINPQRTALLGEGYGGYVALRALQLQPDRFRCAATINAPLDLYSWIENNRWTRRSKTVYLTQSYYGPTEFMKENAVNQHPEKITKPVCLLAWPGPDGAPRTPVYLETRQFAYALRRHGVPVDLNELDKRFASDLENVQGATDTKSSMLELDREFAQHLPHAEAAAYRHIEYFLNAYIYDYQVKLGPLKTLPEPENDSPQN